MACGHGIGGLASDGRCPECGGSIARSLRGGTLDAANPEFVRTLRRGTLLVMLGFAAMMVYLVCAALLMAGAEARILGLSQQSAFMLIQAIEVLALGVSLVGWWMLTTRDPVAGLHKLDSRARSILRALLVVDLTVTLAALVVAVTPALAKSPWWALTGNIQITPATVWSASLIAAISIYALNLLLYFVRFFLECWYLRSIAARIPSPVLSKRAVRCMWIVPLGWTVGWVVLALGPIYATWYHLRTLGLFFREFRLALERGAKEHGPMGSAVLP